MGLGEILFHRTQFLPFSYGAKVYGFSSKYFTSSVEANRNVAFFQRIFTQGNFFPPFNNIFNDHNTLWKHILFLMHISLSSTVTLQN